MARLSAETPLRALTNGISANGGNLWLRWQQNESRELRASVAPSHFSDGNNRLEYGPRRAATAARRRPLSAGHEPDAVRQPQQP